VNARELSELHLVETKAPTHLANVSRVHLVSV
jgi:hypothetical protein